MALNSFADVQNFFNTFIQNNGIQISAAPHGAFWETSYTSFVTGNVPNVTDPNTGDPIPILTKGDGATSNIIYAMAGTPGTLWGPDGAFGQMPAGGPYFTAGEIAELSAWITEGCPEGSSSAAAHAHPSKKHR